MTVCNNSSVSLFPTATHFALSHVNTIPSDAPSAAAETLPSSRGGESPALLRPRSPFRLGSFNVRTLLQPGQQAGLARSLETMQIDICCLSETRLHGSGSTIQLVSPANSNSRFQLHLSSDPDASSAGLAGVGIALSSRAEQSLLDWIPINSRLCGARFRGYSRISRRSATYRDLFVISVYAPTDCSSDVLKDGFYEQLRHLLSYSRRTDIVIVAGDFNARVGRLLQCEQHLGGRHGLDSTRSDNGERLLTFCGDHQLFLSSTNFRHPKCRSATWHSPSQRIRSQIDHIAISYRWRGSIQNCRSFWSTSVDSDHALVCATVSFRFGGKPSRRLNRPDISALLQPEVSSRFQACLSARLATDSPSDLAHHWDYLKGVLTASASECLPTANNPRRSWISPGSLELLERRRLIPPGLANNDDRDAIRHQLRVSLRNDRETWWADRASEMEAASATGNFRKLYQLIKATGSKLCTVSESITEPDGSPITSLSRRLERWSEHFAIQFSQPPSTISLIACAPLPPWPVSMAPPSLVEIRKEIKALKRHKSPGPDELHPLLFKEGGEAVVSDLADLFSKVWAEERIPDSWGESTVIPIYKKGSRQECSNHRGISLIPVASKLLASILLRRLSPIRELRSREEQAGFRPGRGCVDQLFVLRQLLVHRHVYRRPTIVLFLDIRAAFDSVDRSALWNCLTRNGLPSKYVAILKDLYTRSSGKVRVYGSLSSPFPTSSGVRQGCPISPFLFNFAIDDIMDRVLSGCDGLGVDVLPGSRIADLDYADDIALLGEDPAAMQVALDSLVLEASRFGMYLAPAKCKALFQDWVGPQPTLSIDGTMIDSVEQFKYLGSLVTSGGGIGDEVSSRIAKARLAFTSLRHLWRRRDLSFRLKGRVYVAAVRTVLLYGCESWPVRTEDLRRLEVFEHRCLRRIARVWWQHHVSNADVRSRVLGSNSLDLRSVINRSRLRWLGHVLRMTPERLPRRVLYASAGSDWRRCPGGQPMTWKRGLKSLTSGLARVGVTRLPGWGSKDRESQWLDTLATMAQNRLQWRECINFCVPHIP